MEKEKEGMKKEEIHQNPGSMNTKNTTCYNSIRLESTLLYALYVLQSHFLVKFNFSKWKVKCCLK